MEFKTKHNSLDSLLTLWNQEMGFNCSKDGNKKLVASQITVLQYIRPLCWKKYLDNLTLECSTGCSSRNELLLERNCKIADVQK